MGFALLNQRILGDIHGSGSISFSARFLMGNGDRRASGGRQQHKQPVVVVGTKRSYKGDVWSGSRLVGWALEGRPGPRRGRWTECTSFQRGVEPHPTDSRYMERRCARALSQSPTWHARTRTHSHGHAASFHRSIMVL